MPTRAILIKADLAAEFVDHAATQVTIADEGPESLRDLQRLTGADTIDMLSFHELGLALVVDDAGLLLRRPVNHLATVLRTALGRFDEWPLAGDVLLIGIDATGETVDVPFVAQGIVEYLVRAEASRAALMRAIAGTPR